MSKHVAISSISSIMAVYFSSHSEVYNIRNWTKIVNRFIDKFAKLQFKYIENIEQFEFMKEWGCMNKGTGKQGKTWKIGGSLYVARRG